MVQRNGPQLLLLIALCSVLYSRTLSLPYTSMRPTRHADGLFTSGYSKLLGQLSARRYLESLIGKRVSNDLMEDQVPVKRHSDAIFTDNYSRFRKQMAVKKYLNSVLTGKRSLEDPPSVPEESINEPTFQESYDDVNVDHLINLQLPLWGGLVCTKTSTRHHHWPAIQNNIQMDICTWHASESNVVTYQVHVYIVYKTLKLKTWALMIQAAVNNMRHFTWFWSICCKQVLSPQ